MELDDWVERIRDREMPAFGVTVGSVRNITKDENASLGQLTRVVLQDAALTAKVLKLSNSVIFNQSREPVSTVSRAVAMLGFDVLGQIVLSICLIEAFLKGGLRGRVSSEMACSFHAAVQARAAAAACGVHQVEEVFIAALLGRVGDMAFWCFGGDTAIQLDEVLTEQPDERPEDMQSDILGFKLRLLTGSLAREWRLGALVTATLEPNSSPNAAEKAVAIGHKLAAAALYGWESAPATKAIAEYAEMIGRPVKEVKTLVMNNAAEATRVAMHFGASEAARLIPVRAGYDAEALVEEAADEGASTFEPNPDPMLQLRVLRDLGAMLGGKPSLNEVLNLVLEGIYRGLGMRRAVFALLSADRSTLQAKAALGHDAEGLVKRFVFKLDGVRGELINEIFLRKEAFWLRDPLPRGINTTRFEKVVGAQEIFIAPITTHGRVIGVFYADCGKFSPSKEAWEGFQHFVQQASLSFEHVATRGAAVAQKR